jgi:hypothetical protein
VRELQGIDGAGHLNISEHQANIGAAFQDNDGFVGALDPNAFKTCAPNEVQGAQPDKRVIFDHQDNCIGTADGLVGKLNDMDASQGAANANAWSQPMRA